MPKDMESILTRNKSFVDSGEKLTRSNFVELSSLGSGTFAKVLRVTSLSTGKQFAMKVISMPKIKNLKLLGQLRKEISTLSRCEHENIIHLFASFEEDDHTYLIQELAQCSLFEKMLEERRFSEEKVAAIARDVAKALAYLHSLTPAILHRDLKPENVLLLGGKWKLGDFGWSSTAEGFRNTYCGTSEYLAPEMIRGSGHCEKLDVWTLGVLTFELLEGRTPFMPRERHADRRVAAKMMESKILEGTIEFRKTFSPVARQAIRAMLAVSPSERPSAAEVLAMPFFASKEPSNGDLNSKPLTPGSPGIERKAVQFSMNTRKTSDSASDEEISKLRSQLADLAHQFNEQKVKIERLERENKNFLAEVVARQKEEEILRTLLRNSENSSHQLSNDVALLRTKQLASETKIAHLSVELLEKSEKLTSITRDLKIQTEKSESFATKIQEIEKLAEEFGAKIRPSTSFPHSGNLREALKALLENREPPRVPRTERTSIYSFNDLSPSGLCSTVFRQDEAQSPNSDKISAFRPPVVRYKMASNGAEFQPFNYNYSN